MAGPVANPRTGLAFPYVNPLEQAKVTPERIDMGVDYAGTGSYVALGDGIVTQVNPGGWGKYGNYLEYQLTSGPRQGLYVYVAEGVTPTVQVGEKVRAGQVIANLIPGWPSGTETGFGSGKPNTTYAAASGGGYTEGQLTEAGQQFSDFIAQLGGPPGLAQGRKPTGTGPLDSSAASQAASAAAAPLVGGASAVSGTVGAVKAGINAGEAFANFLSDPIPTLLTIGLVGLGAVMVFSGVGRMLGFNTPIRSTVGRVAGAAKAAGEVA